MNHLPPHPILEIQPDTEVSWGLFFSSLFHFAVWIFVYQWLHSSRVPADF